MKFINICIIFCYLFVTEITKVYAIQTPATVTPTTPPVTPITPVTQPATTTTPPTTPPILTTQPATKSTPAPTTVTSSPVPPKISTPAISTPAHPIVNLLETKAQEVKDEKENKEDKKEEDKKPEEKAPAKPAAVIPPVTPAKPAVTPVTPQATPTKPSVVQTPPPAPENNKNQILTSVYIRNNFHQDATLTQIQFLIAKETTPLTINNLKITIPGSKNALSKGSLTAFDITAANNSVQSFNGIETITVNGNLITFTNINSGSSVNNPIEITQENGKWVLA